MRHSSTMKANGLAALVVFVAVAICHGYNDDHKDIYRAKLIEYSYKIMSDPQLKAEWDERVARSQGVKKMDWEPPDPTFTCDTSDTSPSVPTNVHELRPGDIKVVAAMGDSITAGNGVGAQTAPGVALENRGQSWSIGADRDLDRGVITLPNVLRKFNPDLKGGSVCKSAEENWKKSWLNTAEPGGDNRDMEHEAELIVERCRGDPRIACGEDWMMVTLFTGGNDLCGSCNRWDEFNATAYRAGVERGLDVLHRDLNRVFVNLIPMFDITPLMNLSDSRLCDLLHTGFCDCLYLYPDGARPLQLAYYDELTKLVETGKYDRDDFTVVIQPMFVDSVPPIDPDTGNYDQGFLSHDCFHPSLKAHQSFAYTLWNTMMIPYGQKPTVWPTTEVNPTFCCPTSANPYIYTKQNSVGAPPTTCVPIVP